MDGTHSSGAAPDAGAVDQRHPRRSVPADRVVGPVALACWCLWGAGLAVTAWLAMGWHPGQGRLERLPVVVMAVVASVLAAGGSGPTTRTRPLVALVVGALVSAGVLALVGR